MPNVYSQEQMNAAGRRDQERARIRERRGGVHPFGRSGRMTGAVDFSAFMNAVNVEGREVASAAAEGYWKDMRRRYPWLRLEKDTNRNPHRRRTRLGVSSFHKVYG